ncbi:MAG TPA: FAD-binding protein, partial [Sulfurimonas autotrophica]|nr:FAD-binding protein [Sulfurimonas autotrophica]
MRKVVIIGGGISGLTAGYLFANSGKYEVHIVEK